MEKHIVTARLVWQQLKKQQKSQVRKWFLNLLKKWQKAKGLIMGGSVGKVFDPISSLAGEIPVVGPIAGPVAGYMTGGPLGAMSSFAGQALQGNYGGGGGGGGGGMRLSTRAGRALPVLTSYQRGLAQQQAPQPTIEQPVIQQPAMEQPIISQPVMPAPMLQPLAQQPQNLVSSPLNNRTLGLLSPARTPTLSAGRFQQFSLPGRSKGK